MNTIAEIYVVKSELGSPLRDPGELPTPAQSHVEGKSRFVRFRRSKAGRFAYLLRLKQRLIEPSSRIPAVKKIEDEDDLGPVIIPGLTAPPICRIWPSGKSLR